MNPPAKRAEREARLAARLKANLVRRKEQARQREPEDGDAAPRSPSDHRDDGEDRPAS